MLELDMLKSLILTISFLLSVESMAQQRVLRVAYYNAYPHMYQKNGLPVGAGIRYLNDIARSIGVKVKYQYTPVKRALQKVKYHEIDVVLGLIKNNERESFISYGRQPIVSATPCLITNHEEQKSKDKVLKDGGVLLIPQNFILHDVLGDIVVNFDKTFVSDRRPMKKIVEILNHRKNIYGLIQVCIPDFYERSPVRSIPLVDRTADFYLGFSKAVERSLVNSFDDALIINEERSRGYYQYLKDYVLELK